MRASERTRSANVTGAMEAAVAKADAIEPGVRHSQLPRKPRSPKLMGFIGPSTPIGARLRQHSVHSAGAREADGVREAAAACKAGGTWGRPAELPPLIAPQARLRWTCVPGWRVGKRVRGEGEGEGVGARGGARTRIRALDAPVRAAAWKG